MKYINTFILSGIFCMLTLGVMPTYADDECDSTFREAKTAFNAGDYDYAKKLFDYVASYCGSSYNDALSWSQKCQRAQNNVAPYLNVDKTTISSSSSGTTAYVTVSSNTTWEIQYPSSSMYSVSRSGNTLTVTINPNTSSETRSDYFNVKTTDGSILKKISLSQSGATNGSSTPSEYQISQMNAEFSSAYIEHNVMVNDEKCMKIHSHFHVRNMRGFKGYVIAWVYDDSGNHQTSYRTEPKYDEYINNGHNVLSWETITPSYDKSEWTDYILYLPNTLLSTGGYIQIEIREYTTNKTLALSQKLSFTFGK